MMSHSIVLLCCLATLAPAAPAPTPRRDRETADSRTWSKPVDGLRARIVCGREHYCLGDTIKLTLEIQNVTGGNNCLEGPRLSHDICDPRDASHDWTITSQRMEERRRDVVRMRQVTKELRGPGNILKLRPGEILRIEITVETRLSGEGKLGEAKLAEGKNEPRREELAFPDGDTPGVYELRVTFRSAAALERLTSPPVRIELAETPSDKPRRAR